MSSSLPNSCSKCGAYSERPANFCPVCGYHLQKDLIFSIPPSLSQQIRQKDVSPAIAIFVSYSHRDKGLRDKLEDHLSNLKYRGLITTWHDREISAGQEWARQIDIYLNSAHIILLLISSNFMASEYSYGIEMKRALERHERGEARVIPILLRPVLFTNAPFAKLQMLPTDGKPVVVWRNRDSAFVDIALGIERVAQEQLVLATQWLELPPSPREPLVSPGQSPGEMSAITGQEPRAYYRRPSVFRYLIGFLAILLFFGSTIFLIKDSHIVFSLTFLATVLLYAIAIIVAPVIAILILMGVLLAIGMVVKVIRYLITRKREREAREREYYEYYQDTLSAYENALRQNPGDAEAHKGRGNVLYTLGRYNEALNAFRDSIVHRPDPAAYSSMGDTLSKLQRYNEALMAYEQATRLDQTLVSAHYGMSDVLRLLGRVQEAQRIHEKVRQLGYEE